MAMKTGEQHTEGMTAGRRWAIGANVIIAILAAAGLLVAINWISSLKNYRQDVARFENYGLSDRTKRILDDYQEPIQVWALYAPNAADEKQRGYVNRLQDYCDELMRYAPPPRVQVTYVSTQDEREQLVARISTTSGAEATKHQEALTAFTALREDLDGEIARRLEEGTILMSGDSWLSDFPLFTSVVTTLRSDRDALQKAADEIKELMPAGGIPKYGEATAKAKQALTDVKGHFEAIDQRMGELSALAEEATKPDSVHIAMLRQVAAEANQIVAALRTLVGEPDAPLPADPASVLRAFKEQCDQVSNRLDALVRQVDEFAGKFPIVKQHASWRAQVRMGPMSMQLEVADVLAQAGQTLGQARLAVLNVLDREDTQQLTDTLVGVRRSAAQLEQNATACQQLLTDVAARLSKVDAASKGMLDASRGGALLAEKVKAVDGLMKEFEALPELKLGTVADQLKEENVLVIEARDKIRVLSFAEVFPSRESIAGPSDDSEEAGRTFNGDSAISSAILALTQAHPFATVVLTSYEPPAPPQRGPFSPPSPQSWIPSRALSPLRQRLEAANFKVVDWNLASPESEMPKPEEGTESIYVLLPPAGDAQANPFMQQQQPQEKFGEKERKKIRDLLDQDARMVFLGTWEVASGGMFGGPPTTPLYGYGPLLEQDWGITVDNKRRIVWIEPDRQKADTLMVVPRRFSHMPVGGFTQQPIGAAMRGTRFLINDACPIQVREEPPPGVKIESVLMVPARENYVAARLPEIIEIVDELKRFENEGRITLTPYPAHGPFDVMVAAERTEGHQSKGKIVVLGFGASLREDHLMNPVVASGAGDALRLEPPATESVDLFINSLYWLQGRPEYIARGPAPVPQVAPISRRNLLQAFAYVIWPLAACVPGVVVWLVRRR